MRAISLRKFMFKAVLFISCNILAAGRTDEFFLTVSHKQRFFHGLFSVPATPTKGGEMLLEVSR